MDKLLAELNEAQCLAVTHPHGPAVITAGPGTGKTKTLAARIVYLIQSGLAKPEDILALTFTNKAAQEMQTRVRKLLPEGISVKISTFHGICYELLRSHEQKPMKIIKESERLELIRKLRKGSEPSGLSLREVSYQISRAKGSLGDTDDAEIMRLLKAYDDELRSSGQFDFDDLLRFTYRNLKGEVNNAPSKDGHYNFILVDEFQDTSDLQYELLTLMNQTDNLFVIGDPLQAIYGFRGASANIFNRFYTNFPHCLKVTLNINYRSSKQIVDLSGVLFPDAPSLEANRADIGTVASVNVLNEYSEAKYIINVIEQDFGGTDMLRSHQTGQLAVRAEHFSDYAILYRTHRAAKALKRAFNECGIPYQIVGEGSPYEQPLTQAILGIMRYLLEDTDANRQKIKTLSIVKDLTDKQLNHILAKLHPEQQNPSKLAERIIEQFGFSYDDEPKASLLRQFIGTLVRFDELGLQPCLEYLSETAELEFYDKQADAVTLLTIHAAKGLEFNNVFIIACEDGMLPFEAIDSLTAEQIEEERRLLYVAITRARSKLTILHAGHRGGNVVSVSPFIADIPTTLLPRQLDPEYEDQRRRLLKQRQKRAQTTLF